jgi:hypothetical protein
MTTNKNVIVDIEFYLFHAFHCDRTFLSIRDIEVCLYIIIILYPAVKWHVKRRMANF